MSQEIGLAYWEQRRKAWTTGNGAPMHNQAILAKINDRSMDRIYDMLVHQRRELSTPLPLSAVIKVIVKGWKREGTWPEGMEAPPDSH
ncbi:hypothetical protein BZG36_01811 [Bifiguratus adelaidae]|uniref:Gag1-like clamp domain-containing protein n=1 Tax=Bifiguratus adelaidae TaxID=1938954 RepID=A0A261Y283_9FUNG|nr:hypothetical protein BZG36_01811 [Bifiguratus adelaidae]